ncbi:CitMHS family transporter [Streptomyces sp. NPDC059134]|uniref:CitMHS family transporter n=1 Tax=Streptomyces sp. NPDC059134 TaxID=3346738 RepID=UPI0036D15001
MLVVLGFLMIAAFMYLIMSKRLTPIAALILVPVIFGLFAGAGLGLSDMIVEALLKLAPNAGLLFFAIIFFGMMIDVGLFDPLIRLILRFAGNDPLKLVIGTALLTSVVSLDGDGSTTFIIVTSAFLPIYLRLGMSPVVLTVVAATANGVLNTVPWGGSTVRAAAALGVSPIDIFVPMIPAIAAGVISVIVLAYFMGLSERRRLGTLVAAETKMAATVGAGGSSTVTSPPVGGAAQGGAGPIGDYIERPNARPRLIWANLALTVVMMVMLVADVAAPVVTLMVATAIGLALNFPQVSQQSEQVKAHAASVVSVVGLVFAASVLTGVLSGTGMVDAMAQWLVSVIPDSFGPHLPIVAGVLSLPLTFFMSNDAFFFGVLPVLTETASRFGVTADEMARAAIIGQPLHTSSPLVAAFLLLVGLAKVEFGDHQRKAIWRSCLVGLVMLLVGGLVGAYAF